MEYSSEATKMECVMGKGYLSGITEKYSKGSGGMDLKMDSESGRPLKVTITKVNGNIIAKMGKEYSSMR